jgi:hypothetical protein
MVLPEKDLLKLAALKCQSNNLVNRTNPNSDKTLCRGLAAVGGVADGKAWQLHVGFYLAVFHHGTCRGDAVLVAAGVVIQAGHVEQESTVAKARGLGHRHAGRGELLAGGGPGTGR